MERKNIKKREEKRTLTIIITSHQRFSHPLKKFF